MLLIFDMCSDYMVPNMESLLEQEVATPETTEEPQGSLDAHTVSQDMTVLVGPILEENIPDEQSKLFFRYVRYGDQQAFHVLERECRDAALYRALRLVPDPQQAQDVVQECWIRALEHSGAFDFSKRFMPWFVFIIANYSLDLLRKRKRQKFSISREADNATDLSIGAIAIAQDSLEEHLQEEEVQQCLSEIHDETDRKLAFAMMHNESFKDFAIQTGRNEATVRWRGERVRHKLLSILHRRGWSVPVQL